MSANFWAGYISGAIGIIVGNPLDITKVRLQSQSSAPPVRPSYRSPHQAAAIFTTGTAAPILGYGALNALLFVSYNRTEAALNKALSVEKNLWSTWTAGAVGGLATWVISTPTELIKCRAQISPDQGSSWGIFQKIWRQQGLRSLYFGGGVTALRDGVGYGFYFWSYELLNRLWPTKKTQSESSWQQEASKTLLCGGLAGIATWVSVFPLDVIKTRVQTQAPSPMLDGTDTPLLTVQRKRGRVGAVQIMREAYKEQGAAVFTRGLGVCCVRAFIVNAVQWAVYEWTLKELSDHTGGT